MLPSIPCAIELALIKLHSTLPSELMFSDPLCNASTSPLAELLVSVQGPHYPSSTLLLSMPRFGETKTFPGALTCRIAVILSTVCSGFPAILPKPAPVLAPAALQHRRIIRRRRPWKRR